MNKKSNLEKLLLELFENEKEIIDQNPEPQVISAGQPSEPAQTMSDDDMSAWLASTYGGTMEVSSGLNEQLGEEAFEGIEENPSAQGISLKI